MAKTIKQLQPHKFSAGDTVKVVSAGRTEWCKIGDTHTIRICKHDQKGEPVYVVDFDKDDSWIRECNLELVERDRQKGGEWKRHRGGKQPIPDGVAIEVRWRDGEIGTKRSEIVRWEHEQKDYDIMAYKVISQTQAEEVEVKDTTIGTLSLKVEVDTSDATQAIDDLAAKWDQIETPFKWRDEVTELNAYIEKYTRDRDALIERLASEGFALIPAMTAVMGVADVDMSDWRNWQAGDIVECLSSDYPGIYTKGNQYTVEWVKDDAFSVFDDIGGTSSCDWFDDEAEGLKFVRRP